MQPSCSPCLEFADAKAAVEQKARDDAKQEFPTLGIQLTYLKTLSEDVDRWASNQDERPSWCAPQFVEGFAKRWREAKNSHKFQVNTAEVMVGYFKPNSKGTSWCQVSFLFIFQSHALLTC